jgi:uncharacterized phage-associated protein
MPYGAKGVANYLLELAKIDGKDLDPMKIQKLVYFGHGWCLALKDAPLIAERIEAWRYGPVIRELYNAFRDAGSGPITHPALEAQVVNRKMVIRIPSISDQEDDGQVDKQFARELMDEIWKVYGEFSAVQLSNLTHAEGTPWAETWAAKGMNSIISDEVIKEYFKKEAAKA